VFNHRQEFPTAAFRKQAFCPIVPPPAPMQAGRASVPPLPLERPLNTATERNTTRYLRLLPRDERAAQLEQLEAKISGAIAERGEMQEYPDKTGRGPTLFRYTGVDGVQSAHSIPLGRLTPHVRSLLWELAEAIEDEGR
jgi:hypothetical protein